MSNAIVTTKYWDWPIRKRNIVLYKSEDELPVIPPVTLVSYIQVYILAFLELLRTTFTWSKAYDLFPDICTNDPPEYTLYIVGLSSLHNPPFDSLQLRWAIWDRAANKSHKMVRDVCKHDFKFMNIKDFKQWFLKSTLPTQEGSDTPVDISSLIKSDIREMLRFNPPGNIRGLLKQLDRFSKFHYLVFMETSTVVDMLFNTVWCDLDWFKPQVLKHVKGDIDFTHLLYKLLREELYVPMSFSESRNEGGGGKRRRRRRSRRGISGSQSEDNNVSIQQEDHPMQADQLVESRSYNGTEFTNRAVQELFRTHNIRHETTVVGNSHQNGSAERSIRTIIERGRVALIESNLPAPFWSYACETAAYTYNRTLDLDSKVTPFELYYGKPSFQITKNMFSSCHIAHRWVLETCSSLFERKVCHSIVQDDQNHESVSMRNQLTQY
ncbi:uncharacterized protein J8A68_002711 [[Candida] subhashii]|uniref:Integrase catalytic domain-containing protein n=1 Tax=[Candida] subhashii TaxID=561895 RepID=A0A8J5QCK3_9ASCO|nr:uncharacterized protein J8A68_002711 [[Candida] subhashii]KAG7663764.1 hypothetical protein J8A68_002711 [[Candida] subhashii]